MLGSLTLQVGTLDSLVVMADELNRIDLVVESQVGKLIENIRMLVESSGSSTASDAVQASLTVNDRNSMERRWCGSHLH